MNKFSQTWRDQGNGGNLVEKFKKFNTPKESKIDIFIRCVTTCGLYLILGASTLVLLILIWGQWGWK